MSRKSLKSWRFLGLEEEDGEIWTLPFRSWTLVDKDGKFDVNWQGLDLQTNQIGEILSRMPPEARYGGTAVRLLNRIYVVGGYCNSHATCPGKQSRTFHPHNYVFYFDSEQPNLGWRKAKGMLSPHYSPGAVSTKGNIYVFGERELAEVFDVSRNSWKLLPNPPDADLRFASSSVLLNSSGSRILVHFSSDNSLRAYNVQTQSWGLVQAGFDSWSYKPVLVDDVIYSVFPYEEPPLYNFKPLSAYDLRNKKFLEVTWISKIPEYIGYLFTPVYLGKDKWCLIWYRTANKTFEYIKLKTSFSGDSREIHVTAESLTVVSFADTHTCEFPCL